MLGIVSLQIFAFTLSSVTPTTVSGRSTRNGIAPVSEGGIGAAAKDRSEKRRDAAVRRRSDGRLPADVRRY